MGYYAAADGNVRSKGTMYFVLHAQGEYAHGRWVGLSYDGPVVSGYAALAKTQEQAQSDHAAADRRPRSARMTDDLCEVIITAPDRDWLVDLCRELVDARLASSAHVVHPVTSIYRWEEVHERPRRGRSFARAVARRDRRVRRRAPPVRGAEHHRAADRRRQSALSRVDRLGDACLIGEHQLGRGLSTTTGTVQHQDGRLGSEIVGPRSRRDDPDSSQRRRPRDTVDKLVAVTTRHKVHIQPVLPIAPRSEDRTIRAAPCGLTA